MPFVENALPVLEQAVEHVERAVPYIYTAAAGLAARRLYRDGLPVVTPQQGTSMPLRRGSRVRRTLYPVTPERSVRPRIETRTPPTFAPSMTPRTRFHHNLGVRPGSFGTKRTTHDISKTTTSTDKRIHVIRLVRIPWSSDN